MSTTFKQNLTHSSWICTKLQQYTNLLSGKFLKEYVEGGSGNPSGGTK